MKRIFLLGNRNASVIKVMLNELADVSDKPLELL